MPVVLATVPPLMVGSLFVLPTPMALPALPPELTSPVLMAPPLAPAVATPPLPADATWDPPLPLRPGDPSRWARRPRPRPRSTCLIASPAAVVRLGASGRQRHDGGLGRLAAAAALRSRRSSVGSPPADDPCPSAPADVTTPSAAVIVRPGNMPASVPIAQTTRCATATASRRRRGLSTRCA